MSLLHYVSAIGRRFFDGDAVWRRIRDKDKLEKLDMWKTLRRFWFLCPVLASLATQCDEAPRGSVPTSIVTVEIILVSTPVSEPPGKEEFEACLDRLGKVGNHVRPSWRDNSNTTEFDPEPVPLVATNANTFTATFQDVPANVQLTLTVHDVNECRRHPVIFGSPRRFADGRVTEGVTANGTPLRTIVGNDALVLVVGADGVVSQ